MNYQQINVVNCCPHEIVIQGSRRKIVIPRSDVVLRLRHGIIMTGEYDVATMDNGLRVPLVRTYCDAREQDKMAERILELSGRGTKLVIVSGMVLDALDPYRHSSALNRCAAPDTSEQSAIRNKQSGLLEAVRRLRVRRGPTHL